MTGQAPATLNAWPAAPPPVPATWQERAKERLAMLQERAKQPPTPGQFPTIPPPVYAGNPVNVQRAQFGDAAGDLETNRIYQVLGNQPAQAEKPMLIWPRAS